MIDWAAAIKTFIIVFIVTISLCIVWNWAHAEHWLPAQAPAECSSVEQCALVNQWYAGVQMNGVPTSCCGLSDAYWADKYEVVGNDVYYTITDDRNIPGRMNRNGQRFLVPAEKIDAKHQGNPTGHTIIFVGGSDTIYCFFLNAGV